VTTTLLEDKVHLHLLGCQKTCL